MICVHIFLYWKEWNSFAIQACRTPLVKIVFCCFFVFANQPAWSRYRPSSGCTWRQPGKPSSSSGRTTDSSAGRFRTRERPFQGFPTRSVEVRTWQTSRVQRSRPLLLRGWRRVSERVLIRAVPDIREFERELWRCLGSAKWSRDLK